MRNTHLTRPRTRDRLLRAMELGSLDIPSLSRMLQVHRNTLERELDELSGEGLVRRVGPDRQPRFRHPGGRRPYRWALNRTSALARH